MVHAMLAATMARLSDDEIHLVAAFERVLDVLENGVAGSV
jgi:hypothetical protein